MHDILISIEGLSKTEGHASLEVKISQRKVKYVHLKIEENRRFFKKASLGKNVLSLSQSLSRICGTCSVAHQLCTLKALENALEIEVSREEMLLRKLLYYGNIIRDHAMHLYLFSLPDVFGYDSVLDFAKKEKEFLMAGFRVQDAGAKLAELIGGRAIHQTNISLLGFKTLPKKEEIESIITILESIKDDVENLIEIYAKWDACLEHPLLVGGALRNDDFSFLKGDIVLDGEEVAEKNYKKVISEVWKDYSHSFSYLLKDRAYLVGALMRMNINRSALHKKIPSKFISSFPSSNIFHNNLAQAIEILHCIYSSIDMLYELKDTHISPTLRKLPPLSRDVEGHGVIEAPRGLLYYYFLISKEGVVKDMDIITPTAQNHAHMEESIKYLIEEKMDIGKEALRREIEALIRAYDPCFSCASHFLKIRWR